jgi:ATP-binding cassette subfamily B protein
LVVQAYCELTLPKYTADIVDVGIMQGGIENAVPLEIRRESLDGLELFMNEKEINTVESAYREKVGKDDILMLKGKAANDKEKYEKLNAIFELPMLMLSAGKYIDKQSEAAKEQAADMGSLDVEQIKQAYEAGMMSKDDLLDIRETVTEKLGDMGELMMGSAATAYVSDEYKEMGKDMKKIQLDYMLHVGGIMILFTLLAGACSIFVGFLASISSSEISKRLRKKSFTNLLSFSSREVEEFSTASLITRSTNDIQQIQMATGMALRLVFFAPAMAVGGIIRLSQTDTGLEWIVVAAVGTLIAVIGVLLGLTMPKFRRMQVLVDKLNLVSREILTGLPVIRAFTREHYEKKRFTAANNELYKTQMFTGRTMSMFFPILMFVMNFVTVGIVWFGGKSIDAGEMQVGDMLAFISYTMMIVMSFMMLSMMTIMLPRASVAADRVLAVIKKKTTIQDKPDEELSQKTDFSGRVGFNDVSFKYFDAEENTLEHVSFEAVPGETTAIIGSTGSGKSTLINLIPRIYDVTGGSITIDGVDIRDVSQNKLRSLLGVVPQKGKLFSGTIESNLKYAGDTISDEDMMFAAGIAQATAFIDEKEDGYATEISQGGTNVSGGQRQRLSIARAIAKKPKVFIFDDSFSALDYKTDSMLRKALSDNIKDSTVIIVAQRISTIMQAEKIIVLDEGKLVGMGTHKELLRTCEVYKEIAESQLSEEELGA